MNKPYPKTVGGYSKQIIMSISCIINHKDAIFRICQWTNKRKPNVYIYAPISLSIIGGLYVKYCFIDYLGPQKKEISFGIPFLIQDMSSGSFINVDLINPKDDKSNEFGVVLKKNIDNTSLWVVFNMK
ncbi:unnamed protein product (macronuclear) [Paramecium tetraurelia]|uniref:Uncharacterized protein n=1 Tax=Paramecium tetraurelia TaxID=5888 RepID=A0BDV5_PARTE|nr:uncharacterized protein GSPATT00027752001 [Paramecium tetraurelia]CAK56722.1 unnamed protein product [Paramecium tetraurelia]|eukprot:XP_001424120.1 hypothetical protein (macronuclear) [Paramecium tetraurelia strain d4-2]